MLERLFNRSGKRPEWRGFKSKYPKATKATIVATVFLLAGVLFASEWTRLNNASHELTPEEKTAAETAYFNRIKEKNPAYDPALKDDAVELGWRICVKLETGGTATSVLAQISQPNPMPSPTEGETEKDPADHAPATPKELQFWIDLEIAAVEELCPAMSSKIEGWPGNIEEELKPPSKDKNDT